MTNRTVYGSYNYREKIPTNEFELGVSPILINPDPKLRDLSSDSSYVSHWYGWLRVARQPKQIPPS